MQQRIRFARSCQASTPTLRRSTVTSDALSSTLNCWYNGAPVSNEVFRTWLSREQDDHEEGEEITSDELMIAAAKNKYDIMVDKGTWNDPTAEEKIVALEAKLELTAKNINKKVSFELGKKATPKKGGASNKGKKKETKSKGGQPKTWPPPKGADEKEEEKFKDHPAPGIGAVKAREASARNGVCTSQRSAWLCAAAPGAKREATPTERRAGRTSLPRSSR